MTKIAFGVAVAAIALFHVSAQAASVSGTLSITVSPAPLAISVSPSSATEACSVAAGTVVSAINVTGGDGNAITLSMTGDTTDFVLSATTPPANVVVGPSGVAMADCGKTFTNTVTTTQP